MLNKVSLDWLLTLTTQLSTSKLPDNPVSVLLVYPIIPLRPKSDQHQFSPDKINTLSREKATRIKKEISKGKVLSVDPLSDFLNKFFQEID